MFRPKRVVKFVRSKSDRYVRFLLVVYGPKHYYVMPDFYKGLSTAATEARKVALKEKSTVQVIKCYEVEDYGYDYCYKDNMKRYKSRGGS